MCHEKVEWIGNELMFTLPIASVIYNVSLHPLLLLTNFLIIKGGAPKKILSESNLNF